VSNRFSWRPLVGRLYPDDRPLRRERSVGRVKGEFHHRFWSKGLGEAKQEPPATQIACLPLKRRTRLAFRLARHGEFQRKADPSLPHFSLGEKQSLEGLELFGRNLREGHAVKDASTRRSRIPGPDHVRLDIDGALVRLKAGAQGGLGLEALGQLHTGATHAQILGPAHPDLEGRRASCLVQERELDQVSSELASVRRFGHGVASSDIKG